MMPAWQCLHVQPRAREIVVQGHLLHPAGIWGRCDLLTSCCELQGSRVGAIPCYCELHADLPLGLLNMLYLYNTITECVDPSDERVSATCPCRARLSGDKT